MGNILKVECRAGCHLLQKLLVLTFPPPRPHFWKLYPASDIFWKLLSCFWLFGNYWPGPGFLLLKVLSYLGHLWSSLFNCIDIMASILQLGHFKRGLLYSRFLDSRPSYSGLLFTI